MVDMLPFPNISGNTPEEQISQLYNYLVQFKETLEFMLTNISTDNLSQDLINKLNTLGADIEKSNQEKDDQISQVVSQAVTVSDVINSPAFNVALNGSVEDSVDNAVKDIGFSVNFATGELEYNFKE